MDFAALPPLSSLRAFAALAEHGSQTAAGRALNVSHAAIGQQVRTLEDRLGLSLTERRGRQMSLTPDGERLAAALTLAFDGIAREIEALTGTDATRPLHVSTTPAFAAHWLMPRLSRFRARQPLVELMLNPTPALMDLTPGGIDIAIRFGTGDWPGLETEMLVPTDFVIVAHPDLIADRRIAQPDDLLDLPWLEELGTNEVSTWLARNGIVSGRCASLTRLPGNLMLDGARRGDGVAATTRALLEASDALSELQILFQDTRPGAGYYVATRRGVRRPPARAFIAWLRAEVAAGG